MVSYSRLLHEWPAVLDQIPIRAYKGGLKTSYAVAALFSCTVSYWISKIEHIIESKKTNRVLWLSTTDTVYIGVRAAQDRDLHP